MDIPLEVWIASGAAVVVIVVIYVVFALQRRRADFTSPRSPDEIPEWMRTTPPPATVAATRAAGGGAALYAHDEGEKDAPAFVEQIEDILRARLSEDPALAGMEVDLGASPDGGLEIWVNGERYAGVDLIPDERLRQALNQAVEAWQGQAQEEQDHA